MSHHKPVSKVVFVWDESKKRPKEFTIGHLVLTTLALDKNIPDEKLITIVKNTHPESHFDKSHISWYKYQIKKGRYSLPGIK